MTLEVRAALCVLVLAAMTLVTACQNSSLPERQPAQEPGAAEKGGVQQDSRSVPYVLQTGDELEVKFFYNHELDQTAIVRRDGMISLQMVGDIKATGSTPEELEKRVKTAWKNIFDGCHNYMELDGLS